MKILHYQQENPYSTARSSLTVQSLEQAI